MINDKVDELKTSDTPETPKVEDQKASGKIEFTPEQQSHIDKLIAGITAKTMTKAEERIEKRVAEAERMASLSAEEKAKELAKKDQEEYEQRKRELSKKEMFFETKTQLENNGLPLSLADFLSSETAEKTLENIQNFKNVFEEAVEKKVIDRLKNGHKPSKDGKPVNELESLKKQFDEATEKVDKILIMEKISKLQN